MHEFARERKQTNPIQKAREQEREREREGNGRELQAKALPFNFFSPFFFSWLVGLFIFSALNI